jgi:hypothetical protein
MSGVDGSHECVKQSRTEQARLSHLNPHRHVVCTLPSGTTKRQLMLITPSGASVENNVSISYKQCQEGREAQGLDCVSCSSGKARAHPLMITLRLASLQSAHWSYNIRTPATWSTIRTHRTGHYRTSQLTSCQSCEGIVVKKASGCIACPALSTTAANASQCECNKGFVFVELDFLSQVFSSFVVILSAMDGCVWCS